MGNNYCKSIQHIFYKVKSKVSLLGQVGSGKTTALYKLKLDQIVDALPTQGFNVENIDVRNRILQVWDFEGANKFRFIWNRHYELCEGVVFFVDLSNPVFQYSKHLFQKVMENQAISHIPILFVGNKRDIAVMSLAQVQQKFQISKYQKRNIRTMTACSLTGEGLKEGFEWLNRQILKNNR